MLIVRQEQLDSMANHRMALCEQKLIELIKADFEGDAERLGPDTTASIVRWGMEKSRSYEKNSECDMYIYLTMMFMLGSHFDQDPQLPWIRNILKGGGSMEKTQDRVIRYLDHVVGEENERLIQALMEIRHIELKSLPTPSNAKFNSLCLQMLESIFPRKFERQVKRATIALTNESVTLAKEYKMLNGAALLAMLGFVLGSGAHKDPIHPWIQNTLSDDSLGSHGKTQALHTAGQEFIKASLRQTA